MWRTVVWGGLVVLAICGCRPPAALPVPPAAEVTVSHPLSREVTDALEFTGTTAALEAVEVRARVTGFLQEVSFRPRDVVNRDDKLFLIDQRPFQNALDSATGAEAALQAQLVKAKSDLEKMRRLAAQGAASQDELTAALSTHDSLVGQIGQAQAQIHTAKLNLDFCTVTAPIRGRVSRNLVDPGNIVTADLTVLATIVNDEAIYAYFNSSEHDALTLWERIRAERAAQGVPLTSRPVVQPPAYLGLMTEDGFPHAGTIDYIAPALDPGTGTIQVRARFTNDDVLLFPGLFVRIRAPVSLPYQALTVTERALGSDQGQRYLLVVNPRNIVEYRPVKVGTLQGGLRAIAEGIGPDDWIIVNGIQRVRPGATVKPIQAPMPTTPAARRKAPPASAASTTPATHPDAQ